MFGGIGGGGSGKRNISGTASEVAIYDLKHSRNIFNIVMAILFVLDIIAIVITAVYYDKYNK